MTTASKETTNDIAIVGMSCRLPGADSLAEFWDLLIQGRDPIQPLPLKRISKGLNSTRLKGTLGGWLNFPVDECDANFFGLSVKDSIFLDPQTRILLELVWEAFEDANIDPAKVRGSNSGVFVGSWLQDYHTLVNLCKEKDELRVAFANGQAARSSRLSFFFGFMGASVTAETACASSAVALDMANKYLRSGAIDMAVVCGVNLVLDPYGVPSVSMNFVQASDGHCKTFDASADGYVRSEGCGVLILKRYQDAVRNDNRVWALIKGSACCHDGTTNRMGSPTISCETMTMTLALKDANVHPDQVSYVEAHGTGTVVGDPIEINSITKAYAGHGRKSALPLIIGAVKTNVGHTESCSGVTGVIKVVLAMHKEIIPKHQHFLHLNPNINLEAIPAVLPMTNMSWPRNPDKPRIAGVTSIGLLGATVHVILEEPPLTMKKVKTANSSSLHLMKLSAKSPEALSHLKLKYEKFLQTSPESFSDISYTANVGRTTFEDRAVIIATNAEGAARILQEGSYLSSAKVTDGKICMLFSAEGSYQLGVLRDLCKMFPAFRETIASCSDVIMSVCGVSLEELLFSDDHREMIPLAKQMTTFCVEYSLFKLWTSWGVQPDYVLTHCIGELIAATALGAVDLKTGIEIFYQQQLHGARLPPGAMVAVNVGKHEVQKILSQFYNNHPNTWLDFAANNSKDQILLSGNLQTVRDFIAFCNSANIKCTELEPKCPLHSRLIDLVAENYRQAVREKLSSTGANGKHDVTVKFISGLRGGITELSQLDEEHWIQNMRQPVNFVDATECAVQEGCQIFIDLGPQAVLSAFLKSHPNSNEFLLLPSFRKIKESDSRTILNSLGKYFVSSNKEAPVNWDMFHWGNQGNKVTLPTYQFARKRWWIERNMLTSGVFSLEEERRRMHPFQLEKPTKTKDFVVYESDILLKGMKYLKDHSIGNHVIFPGAGLMELCLFTGCLISNSFQEDQNCKPVTIKDLKLLAPVKLQDAASTKLQTILNRPSKGDGLEYSFSVFGLNQGDDGESDNDNSRNDWILHCTGKFEMAKNFGAGNAALPSWNEIKKTWNLQDEHIIPNTYDEMKEAGLNFGPSFKLLRKCWLNPENGNEKVYELTKQEILKGKQDDDYLIHPQITDAMIQASILFEDPPWDKLHLPVGIDDFVWRGSPVENPQDLLCYCKREESSLKIVLMDGENRVMAEMTGVHYQDTTVDAVEKMLNRQKRNKEPLLWEEVWKPEPGFYETTPQLVADLGECMITPVGQSEFEQASCFPGEDEEFGHVEKVCTLYFLNALCELGWNPRIGETETVEGIMQKLNVQQRHRSFVEYFVECWRMDGILETDEQGGNRVLITSSNFPSRYEIGQEIDYHLSQVRHNIAISSQEIELITKVGGILANILKGEIDPLAVLFPHESSGEIGITAMYDGWQAKWKLVIPFIVQSLVSQFTNISVGSGSSRVLRLLEVGGGTGSFTAMLLEQLDKLNVNFEYTFTDISSSFFPHAQTQFESYQDRMIYRKYDISQDPIEQGFCPEYYDAMFAGEVVHATEDIQEVLMSLRVLLNPSHGRVNLWETTNPYRKVTLLAGLLEGYWKFNDALRSEGLACIPQEKWQVALSRAGFQNVEMAKCINGKHSYITANVSPWEKVKVTLSPGQPKNWLVISDSTGANLSRVLSQALNKLGRTVNLVSEKDCTREVPLNGWNSLEGIFYICGKSLNEIQDPYDQNQISKPFFNVCQMIQTKRKENSHFSPRLVAVTCGAQLAGENPFSSTIWGIARVMKNECHGLDLRLVDLHPEEKLEAQGAVLLRDALVFNKKLACVISYGARLERYSARFAPISSSYDPLKMPTSQRYQLAIPSTKLLTDLDYCPLPSLKMNQNLVEVELKAFSLNFRDVLCILQDDKDLKTVHTCDFAGIVNRVGDQVSKWSVGDSVFGTTHDQMKGSHVVMKPEDLIRIPTEFTYGDAAGLPTVMLTAIYALVQVARLTKSDAILIHTAAGGVGLAAIQVASQLGATVIATAGSEKKRNYLRGLGIQHVFNSRDTSYYEPVMKITGGKGVTAVLNSITGPGFKEATLACCAKGARFVEMSKLHIWTNEEVQGQRPDVKYSIIDLSELNSKERKELNSEMQRWIEVGRVKPIPYSRFDAADIRSAFQYLKSAQHIGKVVCVSPDTASGKSLLFNKRSTYVVTGGLKGIGLEVAEWMLNNGAQYVCLVSRRKPDAEAEKRISKWNSEGNHVFPVSADVGDLSQCEHIFKYIRNQKVPPVRGIMHVAGTVADKPIGNQTWENFENTFNPKLRGSWNLHTLSLKLEYPLEHFVFFSSLSCLFGNPGQVNYAASCSFEDALNVYRQSAGLPSTTINWGWWGETGMAKDLNVDIRGLRPMKNADCFQGLEDVLRSNIRQAAIAHFDSFETVLEQFPGCKGYIDESVVNAGESTSNEKSTANDSNLFWQRFETGSDKEAKLLVIQEQLKLILSKLLLTDASEINDFDADFGSLGVDSLLMMELNNHVGDLLKDRCSVDSSLVQEFNTVNTLSEKLLADLEVDVCDMLVA